MSTAHHLNGLLPSGNQWHKIWHALTGLCRVCCVLLYTSQRVLGQDNTVPPLPTLVSIIPPSPTAAALGRFGEIPVSLYTGLPNISVNIYNAKHVSSHVTVPVTLNYHASGIKVDDIGSWVGLGWSLDCGGVVTRTIHGLPDDSPLGYLHQGGQNLDNYLNNNTTNQNTYLIQEDAANERTDLEPDVYSFNFAGHSGQFVFDRTGQVAIIPQQSLLIELRTDSSGFKITAEDGTVYQFLTPESSTSETIPNRKAPETYDASWYLSRIEPVSGPAIKFLYSAPQEVLYQAFISENKQVTTEANNISVGVGFIQTLPSITNVRAQVVTLQHIQLADQRIDFFASARGDVSGTSKLDSITILNYNNERVKHYQFDYQLVGGNRLLLGQVQEFTKTGLAIPPTKFTYNSLQLPALYSKQQDYWGYFNSNTAATLIPTTSVRVPSIYNYSLVVAGADRSLDSLRVKAGSLSRITYPTGGSTTFEYEPHDYGHLGNAPTQPHTLTRPGQVNVRATQDGEISTAQIRLATVQVVHFQVDINNGATYTIEGQNREGTFADVVASYTCLSCTQEIKNSLVPLNENRNGINNYDIELPAGLYRIDVSYTQLHAGSSGYGDVLVLYQDSVGTNLNYKSSGLRIRRIISKASPTAPALIKTYGYRLATEPTRSSGCSVSDVPDYQYQYIETKDMNTTQVGSEVTTTYAMLTSTSGGQQGMTQGAPVGYSEVTVVEGVDGKGGKTVHTFTAADWYPDRGDGSSFPFAPNNSFDYQRGKPLIVTSYRYDNGVYKAVAQTRYSYSLGSSRTRNLSQKVDGLKFGYSHRFLGSTYVFGRNQFAAQRYTYTAEWVYPTLKTERYYGVDGDTAIYHQTLTHYRYGNAVHKQLTAQEQQASDGSTAITILRYPLDFSLPINVSLDEPSEGLNELIARHIIATPIEQQNWRRRGSDSVLITAQLTHYAGLYPKRIWQLVTAAPTSFTPSTVQANGGFRQDARYRTVSSFDRYDSWGHVLQQRQVSGEPISYLWGYNNTLPIAEIKNATYSEVDRHLQALGIIPTSLTTDKQLHDALQHLRQSLPQAQISSYTFRPLVGLSSQTNPTGRTIFFEYDGLGRLMRTRDEQGRILSQQQYHYAGQH